MALPIRITEILRGKTMVYTVKTLSQLSGVTVRALHFYEEAGLLKPAYYGANGYRYYEEKELLTLQQILFFKELGFSLKQIEKVLGKADFDRLDALYTHKQSLTKELKKIEKLLITLDKTIDHLRGKKKMKEKEIFEGFTTCSVAKEGTSYFEAEQLVLNSIKSGVEIDKAALAKEGIALYKQIAACLNQGLKPSSKEVQNLIKKHYTLTKKVHHTSKEVYAAYARLYKEHPAFTAQLKAIHPKLPRFLSEAMHLFAYTVL